MTIGEADTSLYIIVGSVGSFMVLMVVVAIIIACTICGVMRMKNKDNQMNQNTSTEMDVMHSTSTTEKKIDLDEDKS